MGRAVHECQCPACLSGADHPERETHATINRVMSELDERQRRLYAAAEAKRRGWGGVKLVQQITGLSGKPLARGLKELAGEIAVLPEGRIRAVGGGRLAAEVAQPGIEAALETLVEGETAGDPEGQGRWVRVSLRDLSEQLAQQEYHASHQTVSRMLRGMKYGLRVNAKRKAGPAHPDRDEQFRHIEAQRADFVATGDPIISVDAKKKSSSGTSRTLDEPGGASQTP